MYSGLSRPDNKDFSEWWNRNHPLDWWKADNDFHVVEYQFDGVDVGTGGGAILNYSAQCRGRNIAVAIYFDQT